MPPKVRLRLALRGLAKLISVVVVAGAAGVGLGVALSELTGDSAEDTSGGGSKPGAETSTAGTTATRATHTTTNKRPSSASTARVQVVSVVLHRQSAPSARRRLRAVLAIHVRVVNRGTRAIANLAPVLVAGPRRQADPSAADSTGSLLRPLRPRSTADGTLRFRTAGTLTDRLAGRRRAQLRVAGRTVALKVLIGRPSRSAERTR